jgi:hypothetical protein
MWGQYSWPPSQVLGSYTGQYQPHVITVFLDSFSGSGKLYLTTYQPLYLLVRTVFLALLSGIGKLCLTTYQPLYLQVRTVFLASLSGSGKPYLAWNSSAGSRNASGISGSGTL